MPLDFHNLPGAIPPMTEEIWLGNPIKGQSNQYFWMLFSQIEYSTSPRKLWLFAHAECRRVWPLLRDEQSRAAIQLAELHAEGLAGGEQLRRVARDLQRTDEESRLRAMRFPTSFNCPELGARIENEWQRILAARKSARELPKICILELLGFVDPDAWIDDQDQKGAQEIAESVAKTHASTGDYFAKIGLLRHIIGNPFRPWQRPPQANSLSTELATALYQGQPCHFALHDALLDAGHGELAEHFREPYHPKGCWALDHILGKT